MGSVINGKYVANDGTVVEPAEKARSSGAKVGTAINKGAKAAASVGKDLLHYGADLIESGAKGVVKGVGGTFDILGDAAAWGTDVVTNVATGGEGTNLGEGEGWIDRGNKELNKRLDNSNVIDSAWGKTDAGKIGLKGAELVGEFVSPGGTIGKAGKGASAWNKFRVSAKNVGKAREELLALKKLAAKEGRMPNEEEIMAIMKKFGSDAQEAVGKLETETAKRAKNVKLGKKAEKEIDDQVESNLDSTVLNKTPDVAEAEIDVDAMRKGISESKLADKRDAITKPQEIISELSKNFKPEEIKGWATKHPRLSRIISRGGKTAAGIAVILNNQEYTPEEVESKLEDIESGIVKDPNGMLPDDESNGTDVKISKDPTKFGIRNGDGSVTYFQDDASRQRVQNARRRMRELTQGTKGVDKRADGASEDEGLTY